MLDGSLDFGGNIQHPSALLLPCSQSPALNKAPSKRGQKRPPYLVQATPCTEFSFLALMTEQTVTQSPCNESGCSMGPTTDTERGIT